MIDTAAITEELRLAIVSLTTFKSVETDHLRETVPTAQMPALDIELLPYTYNFYAVDARYKIPCNIVIRRMGFDRQDNRKEFRALMDSVLDTLNGMIGTTFAVLRNIVPDEQKYNSENGSLIRAGVIQLEVWAN